MAKNVLIEESDDLDIGFAPETLEPAKAPGERKEDKPKTKKTPKAPAEDKVAGHTERSSVKKEYYVRKTNRVYSRGESDTYDFEVKRERINHNGIEVPYDLIYRDDTKTPLSVVSPTYKMVTHKESVAFVEDLFERMNLEYEVDRTAVISNGSMMSRRYTFPKLNFKAMEGKGDALDGGDPEVFIPSIVVRNSYNKILSLNYSFWAIRQVCSNGMMAAKELQNISIKHTSMPNYEKIGGFIMRQFDESIDFFKSLTGKLNNKDGLNLLKTLTIDSTIGKKVSEKILDKMTGLISYEYDDEDNLVNVEQVKPFSQYLVFNAATEVFSHDVKQFHKQGELQTKLMKALQTV